MPGRSKCSAAVLMLASVLSRTFPTPRDSCSKFNWTIMLGPVHLDKSPLKQKHSEVTMIYAERLKLWKVELLLSFV